MEIHFEIENKCMLNCRHCSSFATNEGKTMNYSLEEMIDFLKIFPEKKYIFLTGGEPLLHNKFDDIVFSLTNKVPNISIGTFTTGIIAKQGKLYGISEKRANDLANLGLNICYFSIYSAQAEKHDWMTQNEGSFDLTLESIKKLNEQNIETKINLVVTKKNIEEIGDIIQLAASLGCTELRLLKLVNHGRAKKCWSLIGISEKEYQEVVLKHNIAQIRITASSCSNIMPCRPFEDAIGCQAGSKLAYVTYEGNVFPCACVKNDKYYNIGKLNDISTIKKYYAKINLVNEIALCN